MAFLPSNVTSVCQVCNRIGTVPVLQQIIGPIRAVAGLVIMVVAGIIASFQFLFQRGDLENTGMYMLFGLQQMCIGIMETIPIIGTIGHIWLHYDYKQSDSRRLGAAVAYS